LTIVQRNAKTESDRYVEESVLFGSAGSLVGIVTSPPTGSNGREMPAVVIMNAGIIHHVGPSRVHVRLARRLAAAGCIVARFDHSAVGDSPPRRDGLTWEESSLLEVREVMDALARDRGVERFVLMGICSGAVTAFKAAGVDDRIAGVVMINGRDLDPDTEWKQYVLNQGWARQYWKKSLFRADSWKRALSGRIDYKLLASVIGTQLRNRLRRETRVDRVSSGVGGELRALVQKHVRVLCVQSEGDHAVDYLNALGKKLLRDLSESGRFQSELIAQTDHTFTLREAQSDLLSVIERWYTGQWTNQSENAT